MPATAVAVAVGGAGDDDEGCRSAVSVFAVHRILVFFLVCLVVVVVLLCRGCWVVVAVSPSVCGRRGL